MRNFASYDVDVRRRTSGVVKTVCNKCQATRHNKRDRSLRVNVDTGHCHCYHCGADFYVPDEAEEREKAEQRAARQRRAAAVPRHFQRPVFDPARTTLSESVERWLVETRCIPQGVIAGLRITEQEEFMPQSGQKERCVCFNYFEDGQLVNTKFRSVDAKHFKMVQGAELIPYNIDSVLGQTSCIIHEGELDAASSLAAGFKSVISVPAGANSNLSWLDRFMETHFEDLTEVIIAVDTDSAGLQLRDELINRLGAERCRVVAYGPGCKDANEHLCKYGVASLRVAIEQAAEVPLEGVFTATDLHSDLLRASVTGAGNDHRLGANEAPPAIISIFTGSQIAEVLDRLEKSTDDDLITFAGKEGIDMGVAQIPEIMLDNTDRNRTSPFAFTGNRFEFRAVGSSANCASAMIALNAAVAEQLAEFKKRVDARVDREESLYHAILEEVKALIVECKPIHFDGNGYSDEWKEEAARRGLDCETSVPRIFDAYLRPESVEMFEKTGVFSKLELKARNEIKWETYTKKIQIESRVLGDLALNHIVPVATRYQSMLVDNLVKLKTLFPVAKGNALTARDLGTIENISEHLCAIKEETERMTNARKQANHLTCEREKAIAYHDNVVPAMERIRQHIDKLELMVDDEMWPLPKYREMLFIR